MGDSEEVRAIRIDGLLHLGQLVPQLSWREFLQKDPLPQDSAPELRAARCEEGRLTSGRPLLAVQ